MRKMAWSRMESGRRRILDRNRRRTGGDFAHFRFAVRVLRVTEGAAVVEYHVVDEAGR